MIIYEVNFYGLGGVLKYYVEATNEADAITIAHKEKAMKHKNFGYGTVYANPLNIIRADDFKDITGFNNFDKVVAHLDEGEELLFNDNEEFRQYCDVNGIYYDFGQNRMLKNNNPIGWFYGVNQRVDDLEVNHYNKILTMHESNAKNSM